MYKDEAAIAIKVDGKVVREITPGRAKVPFGSEYSIYFKNLADRPALVKVTIDGEDVLKGNKLIVGANKYIDLERYLYSYSKGNKFKFIEITDGIAENRGVKTEDGIIRIEWQLEKKVVKQEIIYVQPIYQQSPIWYKTYDGTNVPVMSNVAQSVPRSARTLNNISVGSSFGAGVSNSTCYASASVGSTIHEGSASMSFCDTTYNYGETQTIGSITSGGAGFTTKGELSSQNFQVGSIGVLEDTVHSACIYMTGTHEPVFTTKDKVKCAVCGVSSNYGSKFCSCCGTYIAK